MEALRLYTVGSAWFSSESEKKGAIVPGQLADLAVLSEDLFSIPEERIKRLESVLTLLGGRIVYGKEEFSERAPPELPVMPDWSPSKYFGGYGAPKFYGGCHLLPPPPGCMCADHRPPPRGSALPLAPLNPHRAFSPLLSSRGVSLRSASGS